MRSTTTWLAHSSRVASALTTAVPALGRTHWMATLTAATACCSPLGVRHAAAASVVGANASANPYGVVADSGRAPAVSSRQAHAAAAYDKQATSSHNTDAVSTTEALARRLAEMSGAREATQRSARAELASFSARSDAADPSPEERASTSWRELEQALPLGAPQPHMLTDTFGRHHTYLRISLTERCNLRCTYCMPAEGIDLAPATTMLSKDEIVRIVRLFVEAGVTKVRLTGGEPTVRRDLVPLAKELGALPGLRTLAITSNGLVLGRSLQALHSAGLNAVNISLDTLREDTFEQLTRRKGLDNVRGAIERALEVGVQSVKVNVVVMRGINDDEVADFVELTRHKRLNVRFIEYMPFDGNEWENNKMVPYREIKANIEARFGALQRCADPVTEVAKNYTLPGFQGRVWDVRRSVSFITSMTEHFCGGCNRLRVLADGNLKVCLFGPAEVSLRDAMREGATDEQLRRIVGAALMKKQESHDAPEVIAATKNRSMIRIGG